MYGRVSFVCVLEAVLHENVTDMIEVKLLREPMFCTFTLTLLPPLLIFSFMLHTKIQLPNDKLAGQESSVTAGSERDPGNLEELLLSMGTISQAMLLPDVNFLFT